MSPQHYSENQSRDRYEFVRDELQYMISKNHQNAKMETWRKSYNKQNEGEMLTIANKVKEFFIEFEKIALECAQYEKNKHLGSKQWFERFGWKDFAIEAALIKCTLTLENLAMFIESEVEGEEIYKSARGYRYECRYLSKPDTTHDN